MLTQGAARSRGTGDPANARSAPERLHSDTTRRRCHRLRQRPRRASAGVGVRRLRRQGLSCADSSLAGFIRYADQAAAVSALAPGAPALAPHSHACRMHRPGGERDQQQTAGHGRGAHGWPVATHAYMLARTGHTSRRTPTARSTIAATYFTCQVGLATDASTAAGCSRRVVPSYRSWSADGTSRGWLVGPNLSAPDRPFRSAPLVLIRPPLEMVTYNARLRHTHPTSDRSRH